MTKIEITNEQSGLLRLMKDEGAIDAIRGTEDWKALTDLVDFSICFAELVTDGKACYRYKLTDQGHALITELAGNADKEPVLLGVTESDGSYTCNGCATQFSGGISYCPNCGCGRSDLDTTEPPETQSEWAVRASKEMCDELGEDAADQKAERSRYPELTEAEGHELLNALALWTPQSNVISLDNDDTIRRGVFRGLTVKWLMRELSPLPDRLYRFQLTEKGKDVARLLTKELADCVEDESKKVEPTTVEALAMATQATREMTRAIQGLQQTMRHQYDPECFVDP